MSVASAQVLLRGFRAIGDRNSRVAARVGRQGYPLPRLRYAERPFAVVGPNGAVVRRFQRKGSARRVAQQLGSGFRVL